MNNTRNGFSSVRNQPNIYESGARSSGWRVPAFSSRNAWSRSDSIVNRRLLDDPPAAYSRTAISSPMYLNHHLLIIPAFDFASNVLSLYILFKNLKIIVPDRGLVPPSHTPHQIPIRNNNNLRRQHLEAQRQAVHNQPTRPESNSRSASQANKEDDILKHLTKETYNPVPKSLLLRNLSLYYRNKNRGSENSRNTRDLSSEEEEKRCSVCLEDFEPKETVVVTPCKHMFHEECIVPWLKSKGQCPLCRSVILKPEKRESSPAIGSNLWLVNDVFALELLLSVVRAMEETFIFGYPRRL